MHVQFSLPAIGMLLLAIVAPAAEPTGTELAAKARAVFAKSCHRCHGKDGAVEGGFGFVLDRNQLVARGKIVPGDAAKSKLLRRIERDEMPPEGENPRPSKDEIALIKRWIDANAPDFEAKKSERGLIRDDAMIQAMADDIKKRPEADRKFTRYVTLTHLYNAGRSEDELQGFRSGIGKLVNSLSWGRRVIAPRAVDPARTILRIDLRDYKWTAAVWDLIAGSDPYGVAHPADPAALDLYKEAGCEMPHVRGDWLVAAASRPPLYHAVLQLPATEKELEALVHVDVDDDVRTGQAARAGFNGSGVSRNNRVIERHESSYGYYWKSYDFARNIDRKNIFSYPLGPGNDKNTFAHDGGEIIFSLPNGLQGYMLANASGGRIDKGPTEIVSDPKRPDRAVENGLSCMSCHVRGIIPKDDQVRGHAEKNRGAFKNEELDAILALYRPAEKFAALVKEDAEKYRAAVERTGSRVGINEPVEVLARLFESELDATLAAAELGLTVDEFSRRLKQTPELARGLGALQTPSGTVQRDAFAHIFSDVIRTWRLGTPSYRGAPSGGSAAKAGGGNNFTAMGGRNPFPELFEPNQQVLADKDGLRTPPGVYVVSRKGDFLDKNFRCEIILTVKAGEKKIIYIGIGEADPKSTYREPNNSVMLRIHPPDFGDGEVALANAPSRNLANVGRVKKFGTHRVIIEKKGEVVTFTMDVDNDGPTPDDLEKIIPDIKTVGPFLHNKNTHIFFGGGATFQKLRLVE